MDRSIGGRTHEACICTASSEDGRRLHSTPYLRQSSQSPCWLAWVVWAYRWRPRKKMRLPSMTSAVIERQAGRRKSSRPETASESQTKQQDEDQAERPDEEQTKQRLNRMALPQSKVMPPSQTTLLPNKTMPIPFSQSRSPTISRLCWRLSRPLWRIKYNRPRRVRQAPSSWRRLSRTAISLITPAGR